MGKIGQQRHCYNPLFWPCQKSNMGRYVTRPQTSASSSLADPFTTMDPLLGAEEAGNPPPPVIQVSGLISSSAPAVLTPDILDAKLDIKLQLLLQQITQSCAAEVSKISEELRGEKSPNLGKAQTH